MSHADAALPDLETEIDGRFACQASPKDDAGLLNICRTAARSRFLGIIPLHASGWMCAALEERTASDAKGLPRHVCEDSVTNIDPSLICRNREV